MDGSQPIRRTDRFTLSRAHLAGRAVVRLEGSPDAPRGETVEALRRIAEAHGSISHASVPAIALAEFDGAAPHLLFDCPAVCDSSTLIDRLAERTALIPYEAADAFIVDLRDALRAGHAAQPPAFLGRFSPHDVWFAADGRWWLVGFGVNFPLERRGLEYDPSVPSYQAPELMAGGRPSPTTDFLALILFMRSVLPYVVLPERLTRLMRGEFEEGDEGLAMQLMAFEQQVVGALPGERASIDEAISISNAIRAELQTRLDPDGFRRHAGRLLAGLDAPPSTGLGADGNFLERPEGRTRLGKAQRRILLALQTATEAKRGIDVDGCVAAGWPNESLVAQSGRTRVYAVIRQLRRLGVQVERFDGGYRLAAPLPRV